VIDSQSARKENPVLPFSFDSQNRFILPDYTTTPPFSSFLPGIAGAMGIPMWVFYVNRGQGITSFGVESKDCPIMEFQPANKAYQNTTTAGFRTFLIIRRPSQTQTYEPFSPWSSSDSVRHAVRYMFIGMNELEVQENNPITALQTNVLYFTIPGENHAGLVRSVTIQNTSDEAITLEILDGMPALIPYGVNNFLLKELGRTVEAWMQVYNLEQGVPFYRVRASIEDKPEVETFKAGHFALAFTGGANRAKLLKAFVDPNIIFGQNTSLSVPDGFYKNTLDGISQAHQVVCGKTPCAFFGAEAHLQPSESVTVYSIYGHMSDVTALNKQYEGWLSANYIATRRASANQLVDDLTDVIATQTSNPVFDGYCRQTFLDNVLRGGWPTMLGGKNIPYHIYSRKHGDPERDYNNFFLAAEFYSQGNGNYRDVNQNRRCDVFFNPAVGAYNIHTFMSLIQADGYNPLVVLGSQFTLPAEKHADILAQAENPQPLEKVISQAFTPGKLLKTISDHNIPLKLPPQKFLARVIDQAEQHFEADFGEGYWTDHWTYNLDLIETYLAVYPECKADLLFGDKTLYFYDSSAHVNPRDVKYCLTSDGPRQLNAIWEAPDKERLIAARGESPHLMRTDHGHGDIYRTDLFTKLVILTLVKFTTLDPWGMGVEMEAGKPGWYDALNGLPALFGSSMPETYELKRLLQFIAQAIREHGDFDIDLPIEVYELLSATVAHLENYHASEDPQRGHVYWDSVASAREDYREKIRLGFDGAEKTINSHTLSTYLDSFLDKVEAGIERALEINDRIPPTYFVYQVEEYEEIRDSDNAIEDETSVVHFKAKKFKAIVLPLFLEGPMRALKILPPEAAAELYQRVRGSDLFDRRLKMYKVNASLEDQPHHIGRARAFTPGWLENESIWLHMEYKYLLEVLKVGLYDEYFEDFRQTLIPFLDPKVYQRSPLENSSFLVSSVHPDESIHGAGFVARLSGSTAEFLNIWNIMMTGKQPFTLEDGELFLKPAPILPGWLFTESGQITFKLLGRCVVTYHNPDRLDTFTGDIHPREFIIHKDDGQTINIQGPFLRAPYAEDLRSGRITRMDVFFR
jgi:hypothetical protein